MVHNVVVNYPESPGEHFGDYNKSTVPCRRCSHTLKTYRQLKDMPWPPHSARLDTAITEDTFERRHNSKSALIAGRCNIHWNGILSLESSHPDWSPIQSTTLSLRPPMGKCISLSLCRYGNYSGPLSLSITGLPISQFIRIKYSLNDARQTTTADNG